MPESGRIAAICGAKGGVGTTSVAGNLAAALSVKSEVALVSMTEGAAEDLAAWFGLAPAQAEHNITELAQTGIPELLASVCEKIGERLWLLRPELPEKSASTSWIKGFMSLLCRRFTWVIVDGGAASMGREAEMLSTLFSVSAVGLVVFTPDPMAVRRMRGISERYRTAGRRLVAIQNRAPAGGAAPPSMGNWADLLGGLELIATIGEAREIKAAIMKAAPIPLDDERSEPAAEFLYLAELLERFEPVPQQKADPRPDDAFRSGACREIRRKLHRRLLDRMRDRGEDRYGRDREALHDELVWLLEDEGMPSITDGFRERLLRELADDVLGLGPLQDLIDDPEITEIMVNGSEGIYIERQGKLTRTDRTLDGEDEIRALIERIVAPLGRRIDESSPLVDARLPDGSRVNAIIPPLALGGSCLTIRKFGRDRLGIGDLLQRGSLTSAAADFLKACVSGRLNILISGGTGSGKTTLLNILASFIGRDERIVTIEDSAELRLAQEHVVRLEARPANLEGRGAVSIRDLLKNALRMRPDRIVVGECRGGEALDMLQAMNTGHEGSISTLHANGPRDALARLETMVLMAGMELPLRAIREQVALAVDIIIQIARLRDGSRRITQIAELDGIEGDVYRLQDIFVRRGEGPLEPFGLMPRVAEKIAERGQKLPAGMFG